MLTASQKFAGRCARRSLQLQQLAFGGAKVQQQQRHGRSTLTPLAYHSARVAGGYACPAVSTFSTSSSAPFASEASRAYAAHSSAGTVAAAAAAVALLTGGIAYNLEYKPALLESSNDTSNNAVATTEELETDWDDFMFKSIKPGEDDDDDDDEDDDDEEDEDGDNDEDKDASGTTSSEDPDNDDNATDKEDEMTTILNWSGTHQVDVPASAYFEPEAVEDLEALVQKCHETGTSLRPIGSALSPNGLGFRSTGMVNLANLDSILAVDKENMTVTVQAGARIGQVVDAIREHGLTLPNLASIAEQQMGGFVQVGAHGTGASITPVDDFVTSLKICTPAHGTITLTPEDGDRFQMAKVGLGCMGVVSEVTMRCIPAHNLVEHTFVLTREEAREKLDSLLKQHKHMRYMWIPYEDAVVVVTNDPETGIAAAEKKTGDLSSSFSAEERFEPLTELLLELAGDTHETFTADAVKEMGFGELRDALLSFAPLDNMHIKRVNKAEAEFWRRSQGYQTKPSDQLLQFDCGGQQWVWEVAFPTGTYDKNNGNDMMLLEKLLKAIEDEDIAAPAPIEQRWSASSSSFMSPAHGVQGGLHSWVGIIMYLPSDDSTQRSEITAEFKDRYCKMLRDIGSDIGAASHWAKLEVPSDKEELEALKEYMAERYPVDKFNELRKEYDPKNILGNDNIDTVLGCQIESQADSDDNGDEK